MGGDDRAGDVPACGPRTRLRPTPTIPNSLSDITPTDGRSVPGQRPPRSVVGIPVPRSDLESALRRVMRTRGAPCARDPWCLRRALCRELGTPASHHDGGVVALVHAAVAGATDPLQTRASLRPIQQRLRTMPGVDMYAATWAVSAWARAHAWARDEPSTSTRAIRATEPVPRTMPRLAVDAS